MPKYFRERRGVNYDFARTPGDDHKLSAPFVTVARGVNIALRRLRLKCQANPKGGESLYHATELGHRVGLPDMLGYFLSLKPDLGHVNSYGGTHLSTIIHGTENCPTRGRRDHIQCLRLALGCGVALPSNAIALSGQSEVSAFLADWVKVCPGQMGAQDVA